LEQSKNLLLVLPRSKITNPKPKNQIEMNPKQALEILTQVQLKFVGSGQDHRTLADAINTLAKAIESLEPVAVPEE